MNSSMLEFLKSYCTLLFIKCSVICACSFADDACSAFEDFQKNPQNSSLGSMLPCINDSFSEKLIAQIGNTIHSFLVEVQNLAAINSPLIRKEIHAL